MAMFFIGFVVGATVGGFFSVALVGMALVERDRQSEDDAGRWNGRS